MNLGWLARTFVDPELPSVAVEVRERALGAVRIARSAGAYAIAAAASLDLPEGVVSLSMTQSNVTDPAAFQQALRGLLERAGGMEAGRIGLVLPDPVARVALIPIAELSGQGRTRTEEMLRFRLRKAVPFEIRDAQIASLAGGVPGAETVIAVAIASPVLEGYEAPCRALGLEPGVVEMAGLALTAAAASSDAGDRLLVNWDHGYVSFLLTRAGWPILIRTLAGAAAEPENVVREAEQTLLYHRERLAGTALAAVLVRSGAFAFATAAELLRGPLGIDPQPLAPWGRLAAGPPEIAHAVAGAAAAAARKAA